MPTFDFHHPCPQETTRTTSTTWLIQLGNEFGTSSRSLYETLAAMEDGVAFFPQVETYSYGH